MAPVDRVVTFRPDEDLLEGMASLKERDGMPFSEQIRRALRAWLESKGVVKKATRAERMRGRTRKRP